jgi:hypothetical protein
MPIPQAPLATSLANPTVLGYLSHHATAGSSARVKNNFELLLALKFDRNAG